MRIEGEAGGARDRRLGGPAACELDGFRGAFKDLRTARARREAARALRGIAGERHAVERGTEHRVEETGLADREILRVVDEASRIRGSRGRGELRTRAQQHRRFVYRVDRRKRARSDDRGAIRCI
ncbi:MAG: hypothetical protein NVS3B16_09020 [Vulcanimicrobiaceae bacterium]